MAMVICHKCQVRFKGDPAKIHLVELKGSAEQPLAAKPFAIWIAGIHECPVCGFKIVKIRDRMPLRIITDKDFAEVLARVQKEPNKSIVYTEAMGGEG